MEEKKNIQSISDFITAVKGFQKLTYPYQYSLWFRAESTKYEKTHLIPSIFREYVIPPVSCHDFGVKEDNLISTFKNEAYPFLVKHQLTNHVNGIYFLMQHYGIETRLLDWTDNALISLFFAVENENLEHDIFIWVLDAYKLNFFTQKLYEGSNHKYGFLYNSFDKDIIVESYLHSRQTFKIPSKNDRTKYPIALKPFYIDERLKNQNSCFTLFGHDMDGLKNHPNKIDFLNQIVIPKEALKSIKRDLYNMGFLMIQYTQV